MQKIHVSSILDSHGKRLGFHDSELGEFDSDNEVQQWSNRLRKIGYELEFIGWGGELVKTILNE